MTIREKAQQIARSLDDKAYSQAFVEAEIATTIPFQIRAMRREREWTQTDLANATGQHQRTISEFENPDIGPGSIASLLRIAAAFDVGLIVRFAPFSELVDWSANMSRKAHFVPSRTADTRLKTQQRHRHEPENSTFIQPEFDFTDKGTTARILQWKERTTPRQFVEDLGTDFDSTNLPSAAVH